MISVQSKLMFDMLRVLLKPIARFCLNKSIKITDFTEAAKHAFLDASLEEMESANVNFSVSKFSVMTGIHRRDVKRLQAEESLPASNSNLLAKILSQWRSSKKFLTPSGKPKLLQYAGKESEFVHLVRTVNLDLNPYTVLFELERVGAVEKTAQGLKLKTQVYLPIGNIREGINLLEDDISDLIEGVSNNIFNPEDIPNLHIKTQYDNINEEDLPKIRAWLLHQGTILHNKTQSFLAKLDHDANPGKRRSNNAGRYRVALGSFTNIKKITR